MRKLILILSLLIYALPSLAQVSITTYNPPYGWTVMTGARREIAVYPTGGATNKVNWAISAGGTIAGCTSNCPPIAAVTITASGGTCSVGNSVGSYVVNSTVNVTATATSVDDPTKQATVIFHECDTNTSASVDVEPTYNQAYQGQQKTLQSYVVGYINENVTWSIISQPAGGNGTLVDNNNRDTRFSATVTGRYTIQATSVANSAISGTAIIYVSPNAMPAYSLTPNKTEPTECYVDPAFTGPDIEVGPARAYTTLKSIGTQAWTVSGATIRIHNDGAPGSPTTFHEAMQIQGTGTATQPMWICGVAAANGELPVLDGSNATEDPADSPYLIGVGLLKFIYTNSNYAFGYELPSTGPDYVGVTGIRFQNTQATFSFFPNGSSTSQTYAGTPAIYTRSGRHLLYEGLDSHANGSLMLINNNTAYTGTSWSVFVSAIGNHVSDFSDTNSYGLHAMYIQSPYNLIEGNFLESPIPSDNGNFIKNRGGHSIIRYNSFVGQLAGNTIGYPDGENAFQFLSLDDNLGVPGSTECDPTSAVWCNNPTNNMTIPHAVENEETQAKDFNYGNIYSNPNAVGNPVIQYGSDSAPIECPPCTNMDDRQGQLYFWNNTVHAPTYDVFTLTNPYTGSYYHPLQQYGFRTVALYNNVFWPSSTNPFFLNLATTDIDTFQTNMFETGIMSLTPTTGGSGGWDNFTGPYAYPVSTPISGHQNGLTSGNLLTTASVPYNTSTYIPNTGSPLIGAGAAITDPEISHMPVRFQPDPINGGMIPRSVGASTIGARTTAVLTCNVNSSMSEAAIQSVINGCASGSTVVFAGGTYNLASNGSNPNSAALNLAAGLFYAGPSSGTPAHLVGTGLYPLMYFSGTTANIQYITFDNGFLFLEDGATSVTVDNDIFENMPVCNTTASQTTAIFINGGINNSDISHNTFSHIGDNCNNIPNDSQGAGAIGLFAFHNLTITYNNFDNVHEGIDVPISTGGSYDCAGGVFTYNTFTNVTRMGIELLGSSTKPSGLLVAYNNFSQPLNPYFPSFGFSLTAGLNMIFHDNVSNSNSSATGPYGVEIAGISTQAYHNVVEGNWAVGFSIGNTTAINITNNNICGPNMNSNPSSGSTPSVGNANGFISWQGSAGSGPNTFTGNTTSSSLSCPVSTFPPSTSGTISITGTIKF